MNQIFLFLLFIFLTFPLHHIAARERGKLTAAATSSSTLSLQIEAYDADYVDEQPIFPGGDHEMIRFINSERRYPRQAYRAGIEGRVICGFIVNPDGSISHITVVRGVDEELNREAVRIISRMPSWSPGRVGEKSVPVYCYLTIPFRK